LVFFEFAIRRVKFSNRKSAHKYEINAKNQSAWLLSPPSFEKNKENWQKIVL